MLLLAGAFVWFRLTSPFDTARLEPMQSVWKLVEVESTCRRFRNSPVDCARAIW